MNSTELWERVRTACERRDWFAVRIENALAPGMPDSFVDAPGLGHVWLELKITEGNAKPRFERGQLAWALAASQRGQWCVTLAARADGKRPFRLFDTAGIGHAQAFAKPWPAPFVKALSINDALQFAVCHNDRAGSNHRDTNGLRQGAG